MRVSSDRWNLPIPVVLDGFSVTDLERCFKAGGLRLKRFNPQNGAQRQAVVMMLIRELEHNKGLWAGLLRAWEQRDPERAARMRAAARCLAGAPAPDGAAWFRALAEAEGWIPAMQACYLLVEEFPALLEHVFTPEVRALFEEWWDRQCAEAAAAAAAEAEADRTADAGSGGATPATEPADGSAEPGILPGAGGGEEAEARAGCPDRLQAKEARLDQLLKAAQQEVRRLKEERAELQRRLRAALSRAESYRRELQTVRAERDLAAEQLKAVAGWPAPRERVQRLVQALWQALTEREAAAARADALAAELADLRGPEPGGAAEGQVAAARQADRGAGRAG